MKTYTYTRTFETTDEVDKFVEFQQKENNLVFTWDKVAKKAWISGIDEDLNESLLQEELQGES